MVKAEVGQTFTLTKQPIQPMSQGALFEVVRQKQRADLWLLVLGPNFTEKEVERFRNEPIHVRVMRESSFVLSLIRFGSSRLMFELIFDPTRYQDQRAVEVLSQMNTVTFFSVDTASNILRSIRYTNAPEKWRQVLLKSWREAFFAQDYSERYQRWVKELESRYSMMSLWEYGSPLGRFVETM